MKGFIYYQDAQGKKTRVSEQEAQQYEAQHPDSYVRVTLDGRNMGIPVAKKAAFLGEFGSKATFTQYDEEDTASQEQAIPQEKAQERPAIDPNAAQIPLGGNANARNYYTGLVSDNGGVAGAQGAITKESDAKSDEFAQGKAIYDSVKDSWQRAADQYTEQANEYSLLARERRRENPVRYLNGAPINHPDELGEEYRMAAMNNKAAARVLTANSRYGETSGMEDFWQGVGHTLSSEEFWTLSDEEAMFRVRGIIKRMDEGKELGKGEKALLESYFNLMAAQAIRSEDLSRAYQSGQIATESIPFMAEFALTNGIAAGAKAATKEAVKKGMTKALQKVMKKEVAEKVAGGVARFAGHEAANVARFALSPSNLSAIANDMVSVNDDGTLTYSDGGALLHGGAENFVELASESSGEAMEQAASWLMRHTLGNKPAAIFDHVRRSGLGRVVRTAGFNGLVGEMAEEWYGSGMRSLLGVMTNNAVGNKDELKEFATIDQQLTMLGGFAPMTAIGMAGNVRGMAQARRLYDTSVRGMQSIMEKYNLTEGDVELARTLLDEGKGAEAIHELAKNLKQGIQEGTLTAEDAVALYQDITNIAMADARLRVDEEAVQQLSAASVQAGSVYARYMGTAYAAPREALSYLYDTEQAYAKAREAAVAAGFKAEEIDAADAMLLAQQAARLSQSGNTDAAAALQSLAEAKASKQGYEEALANARDNVVDGQRNIMRGWVRADGTIRPVQVRGRGVMYLTDENVTFDENGNPVEDGYDNRLVEVADNQGNRDFISYEALRQGIQRATTGEQMGQFIEHIITDEFNRRTEQARTTKSDISKRAELSPLKGRSVFFNKDGQTVSGTIRGFDENGNVIISGKKGALGDFTITMGTSELYDNLMHDEQGNVLFSDEQEQEQEPAANEAAAPAPQAPAPQGEPLSVGEAVRYNGGDATIVDITENTATIEYRDENGRAKSVDVPTADLKRPTAEQEAEQQPAAPAAPAEQGQIEAEAEQQPQPAADTALARVPKDDKGEPIYERADTSDAWDALLEQTEGDVATAQSVAEDMVRDKEAALKKAEKATSKGGTTVAEKIASEKARRAAIESARAELEAWQKIAAVNAERERSAAEAQAKAQAAAEQARAEAERAEAEQAKAEEQARLQAEAEERARVQAETAAETEAATDAQGNALNGSRQEEPENKQTEKNAEKNSVSDNTTDTDETLSGKRNDTATPQNTVSSTHKDTETSEKTKNEKEGVAQSENDSGKKEQRPSPKTETTTTANTTTTTEQNARSEEKKTGEIADINANDILSKPSGLVVDGRGKNGVNIYDFTAKGTEAKYNPVMGGVYYADGIAVATDGHVLLAVKTDYIKEYEGKIVDKKGNPIEGMFPNWKSAIPASGERVDLDAILAAVDEATSKQKRVKELRVEYDKRKKVDAEAKPNSQEQAEALDEKWEESPIVIVPTSSGQVSLKYERALAIAKAARSMKNAEAFAAKGGDMLVVTGDGAVVLCMKFYSRSDIEELNVPKFYAGGKVEESPKTTETLKVESKSAEKTKEKAPKETLSSSSEENITDKSEKPQGKSEKSKKAKQGESEKKDTSSNVEITDVGEKIGGARKDLYKEMQERAAVDAGKFQTTAERLDMESEAQRLAFDAVSEMLQTAGVPVEVVSDEALRQLAEEAQSNGTKVEFLRDGDVVYGAAVGGKIYLNEEHLNPNTPIHEYTHLWDRVCRAKNPELWKRGVELMKQTALWDEVKNDPNYAHLDEEGIASEVHSRLTGKQGAARLEALGGEILSGEGSLGEKSAKMSVIARLKGWLSEFWYWLRDTFKPWSKAEAQRTTLEDFINMPLADLAKGTKTSEALREVNAGQKRAGRESIDLDTPQFSISKNNRKTIDTWLDKWEKAQTNPEAAHTAREAVVDYIDGISNAVTQLAYAKWFCKGAIRLGEEDMAKVEQAVQLAKKNNVDPLAYSSPMEIVEQFKDTIKEKPIDPNTVPTLHKAKELPEGVVVYDVDDSEESRKNMRQIINTHFGKDCSPWCLLQGDEEGNLTKDSKRYWNHYNAYPKQVAFRNGRLMAFSANNRKKVAWWDRMDDSHNNIPIIGKIKGDELGRSGTIEINPETGEVSKPYNLHKGDRKNGVYEEWHDNGQMKERANYKDGRPNGLYESWHENGQLRERANCKDGGPNGLYESWYENGQLRERANYKDGKKDGLHEVWYENGQQWYKINYKNGECDGLYEKWYKNGQMSIRANYKDGERDGLSEEWHENGQQWYKINYKDGKRDGLSEEWHDNGQMATRANYKNGELDGLYEKWHDNGQMKVRYTYKNGEPDGLHEYWYENGQLKKRASYKDGKPNGLCETWYFNGQLEERETYKDGKLDGLSEGWYINGQPRKRATYKNGEHDGLFEERYENGQMKVRYTFKNGILDGLHESWYENGQMWSRDTYKANRQNGLHEYWYENGQMGARVDYKDDKKDGLSEEWYSNGQLRVRVNYKDGDYNGLYEIWHDNGQQWYKINYKNGKRDGLYEEWYENGDLGERTYYRNGVEVDMPEALREQRAEGVQPLTEQETALREALVDVMRKNGLEVITDEAEGQRVLDEANKGVRLEAKHHSESAEKTRFFRTESGEAYGYTVGGKIYYDPRIAMAETPIHEYAHLWATALQKANPAEWENVVSLMKGTPIWEEVKALYPELKTDSEIADEVLAHYSGRRGAERLREEQRSITESEGTVTSKATALDAIGRVKRALQRFWKAVCDFLHIHYTSAEEVADRVMKDLLDGVDPRAYGTDSRLREQFIGESYGAPPARSVAQDIYNTEIEDTWNKLQQEFQDARQAARIAINAILKETGDGRIAESEDYLTKENLLTSVMAAHTQSFTRDYYEPLNKAAYSVISALLASRGLRNSHKNRAAMYETLMKYIIAKHGLERDAYYNNLHAGEEGYSEREWSGISDLFGMEWEDATAEAEVFVQQIEDEVNTADLWSAINAATTEILKHDRACGLISAADYATITGMFDYYVPLRGFAEETAEEAYSDSYGQRNRYGSAPRQVKTGGRTSLADNPIATIMQLAQRRITQGLRNVVKQSFYRFVQNRPNSLVTEVNAWYAYNASGELELVLPPSTAGMTARAARTALGQFEADMQRRAAKGEAFRGDKLPSTPYRMVNKSSAAQHVISVLVNGRERVLVVNGNPKLAQMVNGISVKGKWEAAWLRTLTRKLSPLFTNYSVFFLPKNMIRDCIYSQVSADTRDHFDNWGLTEEQNREMNAKFAVAFRAAYLKNMTPGLMLSLLTGYRDGTLRSGDALHYQFAEFIANGGQTGYTQVDTIERHRKALERRMRSVERGGKGSVNVIRSLAGYIELLNEGAELMSRFAAYRAGRSCGMTIQQAITEAKEVSVNFNTRGEQSGSGLIGGLASLLGSAKMFFNASVQGLQNFAHLFKNSPKGMSVRMLMWMGLGFIQPLINNMLASLFGGDDDETYWDISEYTRRSNMVIGWNGLFLTLALPPEVRAFYGIGDVLASHYWNKDTKDTASIIADIAGRLMSLAPASPLENVSHYDDPLTAMAMYFIPDIAQPVVQMAMNKNFMGLPIYKDASWNENRPYYTRVYAGAPRYLTAISEKLYLATSGWSYPVDINPEAWDHYLEAYGGGIYKLLKNTAYTVEDVVKGDLSVNNTPVVSSVVKESKENAFVDRTYWDFKALMDAQYQRFKVREPDAKPSEMYGDVPEEWANRYRVFQDPHYDALRLFYNGNKDIEKKERILKKWLEKKEQGGNIPQEKIDALEAEILMLRRELVDRVLETY